MTLLLGVGIEDVQDLLARSGDEQSHAVAVAWVIDTEARQLLLLRHRTQGWSCPGGHLDDGETTEQAARRELREETGIDAPPVTSTPIVIARLAGCPRRPNDAAAEHWLFGYRFEVPHDRPIVSERGQPGAWWSIDALPHPRADDIDVVLGHLGLIAAT